MSIKTADLPFKAVRLELLTDDGRSKSVASGFIRREGPTLYLYTNWHVVTGYDPRDLQVLNPPDRTRLRVYLQGCTKIGNTEIIGSYQTVELDLYDTSKTPKVPRWLQDSAHLPHGDLNHIHIRVPLHHDVVKIALPASLDAKISSLQVIESDATADWGCDPGTQVWIAGYPYGYSTMGMTQPTAVVLNRYIASAHVGGHKMDRLLDGMGAKGMSGGPVFAQVNEKIALVGIYTGCLYPDHIVQGSNAVTALGRMSVLVSVLRDQGGWPLVPHFHPSIKEAASPRTDIQLSMIDVRNRIPPQ